MVVLTNMLFKKNKSFIRFYSLEPGVTDLYPIVPSAEIKRQWMREPQETDPNLGDSWSKNCPGIRLMTTAGFTMVAPADFVITPHEDGLYFDWHESVMFAQGDGEKKYVSLHNVQQTEPTLDNPTNTLKTVIKLDTPWRVECSNDILLLQMPFTYNNEPRFTAAHGILDPTYAHVLNVQLYWHELKKETLVKAGTPLVQYIPINRHTLNNIDHIVENADDWDRKREHSFKYSVSSSFLKTDSLKSRLQRVRKILDKYNYKRRLK